MSEETKTCARCGRSGLVPGAGDSEAQLLRRGTEGYCANCSLTRFLKTTIPLDEMLALRGPEVLLDPAIQTQVLRIMASGKAQASPGEIDWQRIVEQWLWEER